MFKNNNVLLLGSLVLIILAIGLVAILDRTNTQTGGTGDVRARAAVVKTLQVNATVDSVDESKGVIQVSDVFFSDQNRAGEAKNLGKWEVTPPDNFNLASISPGMSVLIGVNSATFLVAKHTLTATTIVPATK